MSPVRFKQCQGRCQSSKVYDEFWRDAKQPDGRMTRCIECVKADRIERAAARARGENVPTVSEELREERRQRALKLHEEGRFGGAEFGKLASHPKRKNRVSDTLIDYAKDNPELLVKALEANLRSKNKSHRMRALEFLAKLELDNEKTQAALRGAGKDPREMSPEELEEFVIQGIRGQVERGEIDLSGVITLPDSAVREITTEAA